MFALKDSVSEQEAEDILYRRERHKVGSGLTYNASAKPSKNRIVVAAWPNLIGLEKIFYSGFDDSGKLTNRTPARLGKLAVDSARNPDVPEGNDGISYLVNAKKAGIITPLSAGYERRSWRLPARPHWSRRWQEPAARFNRRRPAMILPWVRKCGTHTGLGSSP